MSLVCLTVAARGYHSGPFYTDAWRTEQFQRSAWFANTKDVVTETRLNSRFRADSHTKSEKRPKTGRTNKTLEFETFCCFLSLAPKSRFLLLSKPPTLLQVHSLPPTDRRWWLVATALIRQEKINIRQYSFSYLQFLDTLHASQNFKKQLPFWSDSRRKNLKDFSFLYSTMRSSE